MTSPNIVAIGTVIGLTTVAADVGTSEVVLLDSGTGVNHVFKVNNIIVANIDGSSAVDVSVFITKSGGSPIAIASTVAVPADSTLVVIDKNSAIYLEEGDNLEAGASANSDATITVNYEILNDA